MILVLVSDLVYVIFLFRVLDVDSSFLENVYESIWELGDFVGRSSLCGIWMFFVFSCFSLGRGWRFFFVLNI